MALGPKALAQAMGRTIHGDQTTKKKNTDALITWCEKESWIIMGEKKNVEKAFHVDIERHCRVVPNLWQNTCIDTGQVPDGNKKDGVRVSVQNGC